MLNRFRLGISFVIFLTALALFTARRAEAKISYSSHAESIDTTALDQADGQILSAEERLSRMFPAFTTFSKRKTSGISLDRLNEASPTNPPPLLDLGSEGYIDGWRITPIQFVFIPGQAYTSMYFPETDKYEAAPDYVSYGSSRRSNEFFFIPTDASVVLIEFKFRKTDTEADCLHNQDVLLSAPGYAAVEMQDIPLFSAGEFQLTGYDCLADGWGVFYIHGRSLPPDLWVYAARNSNAFAIWSVE